MSNLYERVSDKGFCMRFYPKNPPEPVGSQYTVSSYLLDNLLVTVVLRKFKANLALTDAPKPIQNKTSINAV